jgi:hypothetical protein
VKLTSVTSSGVFAAIHCMPCSVIFLWRRRAKATTSICGLPEFTDAAAHREGKQIFRAPPGGGTTAVRLR